MILSPNDSVIPAFFVALVRFRKTVEFMQFVSAIVRFRVFSVFRG